MRHLLGGSVMAALGVLSFLFVLFLIVGAILGWFAFSRVSRIETVLDRLASRLSALERRATRPSATSSATKPTTAPPRTGPEPERQGPTAASSSEAPPPATPRAHAPAAEPSPPPPPASRRPAPAPEGFLAELIDNMRRNWMAWLGGVCVALAGIFLVSYGIEMGYLGPRARIAAAVIAGFVLHAAAEYFRRKTQTAHPAFAAMAGGASITLYAAIFAALELYSLLSPGLTFILLAVVALLTMALALRHGPVLAILGILGAYVVPLLVTEHGGNDLIDLGYSLAVTLAALTLIHFVYRPWLWYGTLAGALGWWLISLGSVDADGYRGFYLAAFAYAVLAIPSFDWTLGRPSRAGDRGTEKVSLSPRFSIDSSQLAIALIALAQAASIAHRGFTGLQAALLAWSPLTVIVLKAVRSRESLVFAPWALLLTQLGAWLVASLDLRETGIGLIGLAESAQRAFGAFAFLMAILFSAGTALARRGRTLRHAISSLVSLAPVLWLALAYLLVTDLSTSWQWSVATLALGLGYITIADFKHARARADDPSFWLILAGHAAYSLAVAMAFREATLTLGLAAQVISLTWLGRRFELPALDWIVKGVLALVVARLTLNPWLLTYPADVHWSLWTYGGSALCCFAATRLATNRPAIRKWLEAASLHLLVLFLGAEVRYWLYDGRIFVDNFTLTEAAVDAVLWGGLALSYFNRARLSEALTHFYTICSRVLMLLALACYGASLTFLNPLFGNEPIAATPVWNIMLLAYGAPVLVALAARLWYEPRFRGAAAAIAGAGLFVFVSLEIRHLWHGALDLDLGTTNGEVYTYSAAWLAMAVITMLAATRLGSRSGYKAGIGLLFVVIGKIFLIDMSDLEGLLRVASFMGLGLALLGLAWLYQRTARQVS
jgi:uncharacterized membrane protein